MAETKRAVEQGEAGENVRRNVVAIRRARGLTVRELSALVTDLGRPILPSGINKLELGNRRCDVDDLVALAHALKVAPGDLLLPNLGTDCATCNGVAPTGFTCNDCGLRSGR